MNNGKRFPRGLLLAVLVALIMMIIAAYVVNRAEKSRSTLPVYGTVPAFDFAECRGGTFGLRDMMGGISVVDFIFTRCQVDLRAIADHGEPVPLSGRLVLFELERRDAIHVVIRDLQDII